MQHLSAQPQLSIQNDCVLLFPAFDFPCIVLTIFFCVDALRQIIACDSAIIKPLPQPYLIKEIMEEIIFQNGKRFPKVGNLFSKMENVFPGLGIYFPKWKTFSQSWEFIFQNGRHFPRVGNLFSKMGDEITLKFQTQVALFEEFE